MRRIKRGITLLLAALMLLCLSACDEPETLEQTTWTNMFGTVISVSAYGGLPKTAQSELEMLLYELDADFSFNSAGSDVTAVNESGSATIETISPATHELINTALALSEKTGGAFDITIGSVMKLWKSGADFCVLPASGDIAAALTTVGRDKLQLSPGGDITLSGGTSIDLGGIAKGYACDAARDKLHALGITSALLDFGGNIYALGLKDDGSEWKIGIASPIIGETGTVCTLSVSDRAVVTSGGYERYFEQNGEYYHHILDPKTGYPADSGLLSVTVIADSATLADALSTACFVLGVEDGMKLVSEFDGVDALFITEDYEVYITDGLALKMWLTDLRFELED